MKEQIIAEKMEHKKEDDNMEKLADKKAIERLIREDPDKHGRLARDMYTRRKFLDGGIKFNQYHVEELKKLQEIEEEKYNEKDQKIEELTDTLKRLQAEFENYKKRIEKEKTEFVRYAHADIVANMLPILDSFEIALKNTTDNEKFVEGMKMIYAQIYSALEAEGLRPISATGEKFDPYRHEVLLKEESDKPEGTILEEFQKGYMLNDKVLRFSKVKVSGK